MASVSDGTYDPFVGNSTDQGCLVFNQFETSPKPRLRGLVSSSTTRLPTHGINELSSKRIVPKCDSSVERLPTEILVDIYNLLSWRGVLRVRQTCRRLADVSSARPIWLYQYRRLCDHIAVPPLLGRPLELCNSKELETITLRRIQSELNWHSPNAVPKSVNIEPPPTNSGLYPVPGGRWVLLYSRESPGGVYTYDIQAPMPQKPLPLIIAQDDFDRYSYSGPTIDVDYDEPQLTFTVCLDQRGPCEPSSSFGGVVFYRVTQIGDGSNARLEATKVGSLLLPVTDSLRSIVHGRYYARWHLVEENFSITERRIEIYDWASSSQAEHRMAFLLVLPDQNPPRFQIVAGKKLVVFCQEAIKVFDFATLHAVKPGDLLDRSLSLKPYWSKDDAPVCILEPSICYSYLHAKSASTRLAYDTETGLYGISIPINSSPPTTCLLREGQLDFIVSLGPDKFFYVLHKSKVVRRGSFRWPIEGVGDEHNQSEYGWSDVNDFQVPYAMVDCEPLMESAAITGVLFGGKSMHIFVF